MKQKCLSQYGSNGNIKFLDFFIIVLSYHSFFQILILRWKCSGKTILLWRTGKFPKETERLKRYSTNFQPNVRTKHELLLSTNSKPLASLCPFTSLLDSVPGAPSKFLCLAEAKSHPNFTFGFLSIIRLNKLIPNQFGLMWCHSISLSLLLQEIENEGQWNSSAVE